MTFLLLAFSTAALAFRMFVPGLSHQPPEPTPQPIVIEAPNLEREMFDAMNAERAGHGVAPLQWAEPLAEVARERSAYIHATGHTAHHRDGRLLYYDLLVDAGWIWDLGGENVARVSGAEAESLPTAMRMLMASPGHRDNILHPQFRYAAVGLVTVDNTRVYTILFVDRYYR